MNQFRIAFIVFVCCISSIIGQGTCPTGISSIQNCSEVLCPSDSICYRKDNASFCCGALDTFCPTKMHAFNSENKESGSYLWGPAPNDKWYNVEMISEVIACPFPISFAYSMFNELNVLPIDFDANKTRTSTPKACIKNSDCKTDSDEFCGAAYHPTFAEQLDRSGKDGAPLKFCYNFQQFGSANVKPVITADKAELTGCDINSDCSPYKGIETFCLVKDAEVLIAYNNATFGRKKGFCAFEQPNSALWWYLLAASLVSAVICLALSITCFVLHRKSVLKAAGPTTYGPYGIYNPDAPRVLTTEDMKKQWAKHLADWEEDQRRNGKKKSNVKTEQLIEYHRKLAVKDEKSKKRKMAARQKKLADGMFTCSELSMI